MAALAYAPHVGPNGRTRRNRRIHIGGLGTSTTLRLVAIPAPGQRGLVSAPVAFRPVVVEPLTTLRPVEDVTYAPITPLRRPEDPTATERRAAARRAGERRIHAAQLRRRQLRVLGVTLTSLAFAVAFWFGTSAMTSQSQGRLQVLDGSVRTAHGYLYRVLPGDTIWSIATRLNPTGDPRPLADHIEAEIGRTNLQVGAQVLVP